MKWEEFENKLKKQPIYTINNNTNKSIVLFGNCQLSTIGFFLNKLLNKEYNIYIIISWYCDKIGFDNFNMIKINKKIKKLIKNCNVFIYQKHINDYGVNASIIEKFVSSDSIILLLPNLRLTFDSTNLKEYERSLEVLDYNIVNSDFNDFYFMVEYKYIQFFNIPTHPTHYILFLLSKSIYSKIKDSNYIPYSIDKYNDATLRTEFLQLKDYIKLPGKINITEEITMISGIPVNCDYFDCPKDVSIDVVDSSDDDVSVNNDFSSIEVFSSEDDDYSDDNDLTN